MSKKSIKPIGEKTGVKDTTSSADLTVSKRAEVDAFLAAAKRAGDNGGDGRVMLALDATMSRQPTWDLACGIQADMFKAVATKTALNMQLVYFRGHGECRASQWAKSGDELAKMMSGIECRAGHTQIEKVLKHAAKEHQRAKVNALVYIGDAVEESADDIGHAAGQLGLHNVPIFMFQEGHDGHVEMVFKEVARLSRGSWFRFDRSAPDVLKELLSSIAIYATGGIKALKLRGKQSDRLLIEKMSDNSGAAR